MNKKPKGVKNVVQILRNEPRKKIDQDKVNKYLGKFSQDSIKRELKETEIIKDIASKTGRDPIDVMRDRAFDSIIDAIKKGPK